MGVGRSALNRGGFPADPGRLERMGNMTVITEPIRQRYADEFYELFGALTALDAMCQEFPEPGLLRDPALIATVRDLRLRVQALTACWEPALAAVGWE